MSVYGTFIRCIRRGFTYTIAKDRIVSRCRCETTPPLRSGILASGILISVQFIVFSTVFKNYSKHVVLSSSIIICNQCFLCIIKIDVKWTFLVFIQIRSTHLYIAIQVRMFIRIYFLSNIIIKCYIYRISFILYFYI